MDNFFPSMSSSTSSPVTLAVGLAIAVGSSTVDGKGVPFAGGGLSAGLRHLGRLGLLMLNEGEINGRRLFPAQVVENIRAGGDPAKLAGFPTIPNGSYTSQWWVFHNDHGAFAARGVHGQTI
jgi:hypothetical protein